MQIYKNYAWIISRLCSISCTKTPTSPVFHQTGKHAAGRRKVDFQGVQYLFFRASYWSGALGERGPTVAAGCHTLAPKDSTATQNLRHDPQADPSSSWRCSGGRILIATAEAIENPRSFQGGTWKLRCQVCDLFRVWHFSKHVVQHLIKARTFIIQAHRSVIKKAQMSPTPVMGYWVSTSLACEIWTVQVRTWLHQAPQKLLVHKNHRGQDLRLHFIKALAQPLRVYSPFTALSQMSFVQWHRTQPSNQSLVSQSLLYPLLFP